MRSKLLAAVLACSAVFGLASCGAMLPESSSETETTTGTAAQRVIETTKTATMGDDYDEDDEDDEEPEEEEEDTEEDDNDDDIASEPFYEVACPNCGETVYVSEDDLDAGEANCAHCGVTFEVAVEGDGEEDAEDGPVQYEVTCPDCGTTAVFEEDELLDGAPKCPNCGKPLDFEVTEE